MSDTAPAAAPDVPVASAAFVPEPLPPSTFANLKAMLGVVPLKYPVLFSGKTWDRIHLRVFTVAQVAAVIRNHDRRLKVEPDAVFTFPVYVDEEGADVPEGLMQQLAQDDVDDVAERARDFLPRRFRPSTTAAETPSSEASPSDSDPPSGGPTGPSSAA